MSDNLPRDGKQVVAAVICREDFYLLCQRPQGKRHALLWEFPGGKIEPGESLFAATQRELREELGVDASSIGEILLSVVDELSGFTINFLAVTVEGEPRPIEHAAITWLSLNDAAKLSLAPSDKTFVEKMRR